MCSTFQVRVVKFSGLLDFADLEAGEAFAFCIVYEFQQVRWLKITRGTPIVYMSRSRIPNKRAAILFFAHEPVWIVKH